MPSQWNQARWMGTAPSPAPIEPQKTAEPVVDPVPVTAPDAPAAEPTPPTEFDDTVLHSVSTALDFLEAHPEQAEALGVAEAAGKNRKMIARAVAETVEARG